MGSFCFSHLNRFPTHYLGALRAYNLYIYVYFKVFICRLSNRPSELLGIWHEASGDRHNSNSFRGFIELVLVGTRQRKTSASDS